MDQLLSPQDLITRRLETLAQQPFRSLFHLRAADREVIDRRGMAVIRQHGRDFIRLRLSPARPLNDGKQTPFRGHPVFVAQHATATCCRSCLQKWHGIPKGYRLTQGQQVYVIGIIEAWLRKQLAS